MPNTGRVYWVEAQLPFGTPGSADTGTAGEIWVLSGAPPVDTATMTETASVFVHPFTDTDSGTEVEAQSSSLPVHSADVNVPSDAAILFDGSSTYIDLGSPNVIPNASPVISVAAWINPTTVTAVQNIIANRHGATSQGWHFQLNSNGQLQFGFYDTSNVQHGFGGAAGLEITPGVLTHVGATWDGTTCRFYINGVENVRPPLGSAVTISAGPDNVRIGHRLAAAALEFFNGIIDDVEIWNTVLTQAQFATLAAGGNIASPISYYPLNEGSGTVARDAGSNNLPGTIVNGTWQGGIEAQSMKAAITTTDAGTGISSNGSIPRRAFVFQVEVEIPAGTGASKVVADGNGPTIEFADPGTPKVSADVATGSDTPLLHASLVPVVISKHVSAAGLIYMWGDKRVVQTGVLFDGNGATTEKGALAKISSDIGVGLTEVESVKYQILGVDSGVGADTPNVGVKSADFSNAVTEIQAAVQTIIAIDHNAPTIEIASQGLFAPIGDSDAGTETENWALAATAFTDTDGGTDSEIQTANAAYLAPDAGSDSEPSSELAQLAATDAGSDTELGFANAPVAGTDSNSTTTEFASVLTTAILGTDTGSIVEQTSQALYATDVGSDTEILSIAFTTVDASGPVSETANAGVFTPISGADFSVSTDAFALAAKYTQTESGGGDDSAGLNLLHISLDLGVTTETIGKFALVSADFPTAIEQATIPRLVTIDQDISQGSDLASLVYRALDTETGTGSDLGLETALYAATDTFTSHESSFIDRVAFLTFDVGTITDTQFVYRGGVITSRAQRMILSAKLADAVLVSVSEGEKPILGGVIVRV